ncbi:S-layer homology domain-containing protein [Paenibacillus sp. NPDC057934]|uniref:S-layer homology domain-containing protein n=1 Tax=Paenibacillus sp. NPDC057934 TaxID=3346282 RepID=UPI0036DA7E72
MKKTISVLLILLLLVGTHPWSSVFAAPDSPSSGGFQSPTISDARSIAYHDGYIYVAQRGPGGIYRVDAHTGSVTKVLDLGYIMSVALNQAGDLFYTVDSTETIKKIDKNDLKNLPLSSATVSTVSKNFYNTGFKYVYGLAFDEADNLYFSDYINKGIYKLPQGQSSATTIVKNLNTHISKLSISPDGVIYGVGDDSNLYTISMDGSQVKKKSNAPIPGLNGIAFLPDGEAFLSRSNSITPAPEFNIGPPPDTEKPTITLNGAANLSVKYGSVFTDPGVIVTDNVDTGLAAQVTYSMNDISLPGIDTSVPGTYVLRYNATDTAGNKAVEVKRTVTVREFTLNLASGAPVAVNKPTSSGNIADVTDDSVETGWSSNSNDGPWKITLDMSEGVSYNDIVIVSRAAINSYTVKFSDDLTEPFENIENTSTIGPVNHSEGRYNGYTTETLSLPEPVTKRYVQVSVVPSADLTIQEIEIYNRTRIPAPVHVDGVSLNAETQTLTVGGPPITLIPIVSPADADNQEVVWSSSNPAVATVKNGVVTPISVGVATITVTTEDGEFTASCIVTVHAADSGSNPGNGSGENPDHGSGQHVTGISLNADTQTLTVSGPTATLSADIIPADATNKTVVWSSSNPVVATVENGVVTPISAGVATITVTTEDGGFSSSCLVTVNAADSGSNPGEGSGENPSGDNDGNTDTSAGTVTVSNPTEKLSVLVDGGGDNNISSVTITRTTDAKGQKTDEITFSPDNALNTVSKLQAAGLHTARILIPDPKDEVVQTKLNLPLGTVQQLAVGGIDLEMVTPNASITIPYVSLSGIAADVYFRILPIKQDSERLQVEERAKQEQIVKDALGNGGIRIVGRPMTIETNLSSRAVDLKLPLPDSAIPTNAREREQWLANLAIFIEHSDGERELIKPKIETNSAGQLSLVFTVLKFSTFTIVNIDNWSAYLNPQKGFINGYPDGTFKPEKGLSRAEIAAMLSRVGAGDQGTVPASSYTDVAATFWAASFIAQVQTTGLMKGYAGSFVPEAMITRAEMATIASRWLKLTGVGASDANDIQGHWAQADIERVNQVGIMTDTQDGHFRPNEILTRAEAVVVFNRILRREPSLGSISPSWSDVPVTYWAFGDIEAASHNHQ